VIILVKIFASLQRTGRSPWGRVNQDKIFAFLISSSLFLIFSLSACFQLINCSLNLFTYNWINCVSGLFLIYWIVFNHLESVLTHFYTVNCFLGLSLIISVVLNWLFTGQSRITRVDWLNLEFSFSISKTNQICEKILKVQFTPLLNSV